MTGKAPGAVSAVRRKLSMQAMSASTPTLPSPFAWRRHGDMIWIETPLPGGRAVFSTRLGGFSEGPYRWLNLGILTDDDPDVVARNREALALRLNRDPEMVAMGWQVHGTRVQRRSERLHESGYARRGTLAKADAQVTDQPDVTAIVLAADCVPLALGVDGTVAMVHCGWRGVAGGIVGAAVEACYELAGAGPRAPGAALGPGIGPCCYQVGREVRKAFANREYAAEVSTGGALDLKLAVRRELERAGVAPDRISDTGLCTSCHADLFFSHRRDGGVTGRQAGLAWREP